MEVTTYAVFEDIQYEIRKLLQNAKESVRICVAWVSLKIYRPILVDLVKRGVDVHLIVNKDGKNDIDELGLIEGLTFTPILMRVRKHLMHNKFCVIDDRIVITGSYNWSNNAEGHLENIVVVRNDLSLVLQFRHEFEDLANYHTYEAHLKKCHCGSSLFNLAMFGYESGKYSESTVGFWSVCALNNHVELMGSHEEQYLHSQLGLESEDDSETDLRDINSSVEDMRDLFHLQRNGVRRVQSYFDGMRRFAVHGIGWVVCTNAPSYYKGYADFPEFEVEIPYRNAYFKKIVPSKLYDYDGDVGDIIDVHKPVI